MRHVKHEPGVRVLLSVVFALAMLCGPSCKERDVPEESSQEVDERGPISDAKKKLIESFDSASVEVENGQATVIRIPEGYMFVVPTKYDLDMGVYKIFFSKSGNFRNDGEIVAEGGGVLIDLYVVVKSHRVMLGGGSKTSVYVELSPFDETASIAKYSDKDPNSLDLAKLEFSHNPGFNREAFKEFLGEELERIRQAHGGKLQTRVVVMEAKPETSPLHPAFEWNNKKAGNLWREYQARHLIRSVRIVSDDQGDEPAFVHVPTSYVQDGKNKQGYYQSGRVLVENIDEFQLALGQLISRVAAATRAAKELELLASKSRQEDRETLALIVAATKALATASTALRSLKH